MSMCVLPPVPVLCSVPVCLCLCPCLCIRPCLNLRLCQASLCALPWPRPVPVLVLVSRPVPCPCVCLHWRPCSRPKALLVPGTAPTPAVPAFVPILFQWSGPISSQRRRSRGRRCPSSSRATKVCQRTALRSVEGGNMDEVPPATPPPPPPPPNRRPSSADSLSFRGMKIFFEN